MGEEKSFFDFMEESRAKQETIIKEIDDFREKNPILTAGVHVLDEDKSVRWNREEIARRNRSTRAKTSFLEKKYNDVLAEISEEITRRIKEEYGFGDTITNIIYGQAYEDGHASGPEEVYCKARKYADFTERIMDAME